MTDKMTDEQLLEFCLKVYKEREHFYNEGDISTGVEIEDCRVLLVWQEIQTIVGHMLEFTLIYGDNEMGDNKTLCCIGFYNDLTPNGDDGKKVWKSEVPNKKLLMEFKLKYRADAPDNMHG